MNAGFASRTAWLKSISSKEYAELLALQRLEPIGDDRRDLGILKLGIAIMRALGWKDEIDPNVLLPIKHEQQTQSPEEMFQALFGYSQQHNRKWQPSPSEP